MQDPTQLWVHATATAWGRKCDNIFPQSAEPKAYSGAREDFQDFGPGTLAQKHTAR